jgi:hypothetical protein
LNCEELSLSKKAVRPMISQSKVNQSNQNLFKGLMIGGTAFSHSVYQTSYLHRKGMKPPAVVAELAAVYHEGAFDGNRMKYWLHEIELHCSNMSDRPSSG